MKKLVFAIMATVVLLTSCSKEESQDTTISGTLIFKNASGVIQIGSQFQNSVYEKNCEVIISGQNLSGNMLVIEHVQYQFPQYFGHLDYLFIKGDTVLDSVAVILRDAMGRIPIVASDDTTPQRDTILYAKKFVSTEIIPIETQTSLPVSLGIHKLMHVKKAYIMNSRKKIEIPFAFK